MAWNDQDVEQACKRIRLQSPEPDVASDDFEDFLLSDTELFSQLAGDNGSPASVSEPTAQKKDGTRLAFVGDALVADTVRHVCLGTIILEATSSFFKDRQDSETPVTLRECGGIIKLSTADTGAYAGILKASFPSDLLHHPSVKLIALLTAPASLRVIISSQMEEAAQIGALLSNNDLFLQHPSPRDIEYFELEMEYFNPQFLVTPGSCMPQLEDLAIEYNDSTSNASLALDEQKKGQLIVIFDTAADLSIRPTTEPSPRLQTHLKDYQLKALTVMSEKECANLENPQCPSLWAVARDASTRGHRQTLAKQFRNNDIVLTTYQTLRSEWTNKGPLFTKKWFRVVLDEAHRIGNRSTQVFQAACELQSSRRWCLTGTPIVNSIDNYGALLAFIKMEPLDTKATFDHWISTQIRDNLQEGIRKLRILVEATCLRRTKCSISQALPPPTVREEKVDLSPYDRSLYDFFESEAAKNAADSSQSYPANHLKTGKEKKNVLSMIHNLRRICDHGEDLLPASDIEATSEQLSKISGCTGEEVLISNKNMQRSLMMISVVFSYWTKMLDLVQHALLQAGFLCERIDGQYSIKQRENALTKFAIDPCCTVMLATFGSGGEGIDLTSANCVHLLEPHWNPMAEEQAIARVHRIGQQRQVTVTKYITPDSIEEYVQSIQDKKIQLIQDTWSTNDDSMGNSINHQASRKLEQWLAQRSKI
ncbi:helicase-like transcription factor [Fusarium subglutinans]|uniref:Helicase-like transcription factor n=1 Tax=Gibberella subglutinans TaxID=42677 RepID=A0A8H5KIN0_GIBSU|nr:helicase-like transcription factor [Fusarium subglutinans]KAF5574949.1 helicase-like transcription factor [Fusarium subglutinans]